MARFLVEVSHSQNVYDCAIAVEALLRSGSHFLTHADWGCKDGDHRAWIIVELDSKEEALAIVPPAQRAGTRIVKLNYFTMAEIEEIRRHHGV